MLRILLSLDGINDDNKLQYVLMIALPRFFIKIFSTQMWTIGQDSIGLEYNRTLVHISMLAGSYNLVCKNDY